MHDDMNEEVPPGEIDLEEVKALWKFRVNRDSVLDWAARDIRFLVYDDTNLKMHGYDSDDEQAMLQRALDMSLEDDVDEEPVAAADTATDDDHLARNDDSGADTTRPIETKSTLSEHAADASTPEGKEVDRSHMDASVEGEDADLQRAIELSLRNGDEEPTNLNESKPNPAGGSTKTGKPERANPCAMCLKLPEFPAGRDATKFRLYQPWDDEQKKMISCNQYVAVSYCWPQPETDAQGKIKRSKGSYHVRELDGSIRPSRAPDNILDKAVEFARACDIRMIWIDQECLPQPTEDKPLDEQEEQYQQLGVQAMDLVYNKAAVTAGIHNGEIKSKAQLEALEGAIALGLGLVQRQRNYTIEFFDGVISFLDMVCKDRWYTRAWIAQEFLSAMDKLYLIFRCADGVPGRKRTFYRNTWGMPTHSPKSAQDTASSIVPIHVEEFRALVRIAGSFAVVSPNLPFGPMPTHMSPTFSSIIDAARRLHPAVAKTNLQGMRISAGGNLLHGDRQTMDAAGALTILSTRKCFNPQDRVVIVANMCGYEVRLDTSQLSKHCSSLRTSILALMLLNGDFSALVPEVYTTTGHNLKATDGLVFPFNGRVDNIEYCKPRATHMPVPKLVLPPGMEMRSAGVPVSGYMWSVQDKIDLSIIKYQWGDIWNLMRSVWWTFKPAANRATDPADRERRRKVIHNHFNRLDILRIAKDEIIRFGAIPNDSKVWDGVDIDPEEVRVKVQLDPSSVDKGPSTQRFLAHIVFDILKYLKAISTSEPRALGVANSIWHSIRVDTLRSQRDEKRNLPDYVGEELFNHPDIIQNPFASLQLGRDRDTSYTQLWFINHIMTHGSLWVGKYMQNPQPIPPASIPRPKDWEERRKPIKGTILYRQTLLQIQMAMISAARTETDQKLTDGSVNASNMAFFMMMLNQGEWDAFAEERRERELVSIFDVDGPCTVFTPYVADWEFMPHPVIRSLSVCWVLDKQESRGEEKEASDEDNNMEAVGSTSKMTEDSSVSTPTYRVLRKVKGMWQVIELPPAQRYFFV